MTGTYGSDQIFLKYITIYFVISKIGVIFTEHLKLYTMSILVGLKQNEASGAYHGSDGFQGFSMSATQLDILKEGTVDELKTYVTDMKSKSKVAKSIFQQIEDKQEYSPISEKAYDNAYKEYRKATILDNYSKLMILEGIVL